METAAFGRTGDGGLPVAWLADPDWRRSWERRTELYRPPLPAVLDTSCVRTGLEFQLRNGVPPASISAARDGTIRLFMELDTLRETGERLSKFAGQLRVPVEELRRMFVGDWLPYIQVVSLNDRLRSLDERAVAVRDLDPDDYPAAALAALLSPCVVLTHNHKHFRPLGVVESSQGVDGVIAVIGVKVGERELDTILKVPAIPVVAAGQGVKWAADRVGPIVWIALVALFIGGVVYYRRQPEEKKEAIKTVAGGTYNAFMEMAAHASDSVDQARGRLDACAVPGPRRRGRTATVLRELAISAESMSAQRLYDELDSSVRPSVTSLREFLHANKASLFYEERPGSFTLGRRYIIRPAISS